MFALRSQIMAQKEFKKEKMGQKDLVLPQNSSPAISQGAKW
jgi:hypothetical protein